MDKEQAIELLKLAVPIKALTQQEYSDFVEAVNMGMDALEQPTSLDTIDRKAAIDVIEDYPHGNVWNVESMEEMVDKIKTLPTIQPEPTDEQIAEYCKRRCLHIVTDDFFRVAQPETHEGYWIDKGWNGDWAWQTDGRGNCWRVIECSECGKSVLVESNFCPHCGAEMKGAQPK